MALLIKNGRVLDPASGLDDYLDILVENGTIRSLGKQIDLPSAYGRADITATIDATGLLILPGLVDMHTHLREPGHEYKETIASGSRAGAAGGFTSLVCMANTNPPNDTASVTEFILEKARKEACINIFPVGALTRGLRGEYLTEMGELKEAGVVALSDDGCSVKNAAVMRRGLEYAKNFSLPVICHCEDHDLSAQGVMHEGITSAYLGLRGIPAIAEETIVARDIALAEWTNHPVHIAHVSSAGSVRIIREAKSRGVRVTAETAPHYFTLTDEAVRTFDTSTKVNPPLRTPHDVEALKQGLRDGTIDAIASDHAPHSSLEKDVEFDAAACGIIGLETSLPLTLALVAQNVLSLRQAAEKLTCNPARILGLNKGRLAIGADADITIIDLNAEYTVDINTFKSKSKNSPFHRWRLKGCVRYTIVSGTIVYQAAG
jgi:dihydroorotase